MDFSIKSDHPLMTGMKTEEDYRRKAINYRNSKAYSNMKKLYPLLKNSIKECKDEILVA